MRKTLVLALGLAAGAAALSGCGTTPEPDHRTTSATRVDTAELHRRPPVTELLFTPSTRSHEAQRRFTIACMAKRGFRYAPVPGAGAAQGDDQLPQPFGLESTTPPPESAPPAPDTPPKPGSPESTEAYGQALFGDQNKRVTAKGTAMSVSRPGNGCLAEAETRVLGDGRMRWLQVRIMLFEAQEQAREDVEKDPAFQAVTARWRACMDRAGFPEPDPARLLASLRTPGARATSTALAADLRCKDETGYLDTAYTRLAAVQQRWLDRNPAVAKDWKSLTARQEKESRAVLANAPTAVAPSPRSE
ncbi:hypothetical protein [Streptomyces sp. TLI_105]|uniref:hypothetical protein n=1 Tax=Streptomyces sp. TLI_105 TaxID=1881019 RepID=UPI0008968BFC|nr:hypothetical protein [Streptomyces sp. TLI_105]SED48533.1 hypothetical protein SAMN05428939_5330 [Streptomyces sp. TLI_105]